jgi:hypothetical protein
MFVFLILLGASSSVPLESDDKDPAPLLLSKRLYGPSYVIEDALPHLCGLVFLYS